MSGILKGLGRGRFEEYNKFAKATPCSLPLPKNNESWVAFNGLTLQNSNDIHYFKVEYNSSDEDDHCELDAPRKAFASEFGYEISYCPPQLVILADCAGKGGITVEVYDENNLNKAYLTKPAGNTVQIYNPTKIFTNKKLFIAIKNSDENDREPLSYDLKIGYLTPLTLLRPLESIRTVFYDLLRRILKKYFDKIDLPRPVLFEDMIRIVMGKKELVTVTLPDLKTFIEHYADTIAEDKFITDLTGMIREDAGLLIGKELNNLGKLAMNEKWFDLAERLMIKGNRIFEAKGAKILLENGLKDLKQLYTVTKQTEKIKQLNVDKKLWC